MSSQLATQQKLNLRRVVALALVVAFMIFILGVVSSHTVASCLETISHGLHSSSMWLNRAMVLDHSGASLEAQRTGEDPDLFSKADHDRLSKR